MAYSQYKATFYVQLEDDVLSTVGAISIMKQYAVENTAYKKPWFILDFGHRGFIGKEK